jgi:hypothetical protein
MWRRFVMLCVLVLPGGCTARPEPPQLALPETEVPLTRTALAGRWILRRSIMVKSEGRGVWSEHAVHPDSGDVEVFDAAGRFESPRVAGASGQGTYRIAGDTVAVHTEDGDSIIYTSVRVARRWLVQVTDQGAHDFDGDGRTEWAKATYLYERQW